MIRVKWWFFVVCLSLKWVFRTNLGDKVMYENKEYIVSTGERPQSWRLSGLVNPDSGWVPRKHCKKVVSFSNFWGSFKSGYRFYMLNWYKSWVAKGIEPWMRGCSIW